MKDFFTLEEIAQAQLPGLPGTANGLHRMAIREGWRANAALARQQPGKSKPVWEYHLSLLPPAAQTALTIAHKGQTEAEWEALQARKNTLWARFERLSNAHRAIAKTRLAVLERVETLLAQSDRIGRTAAVTIAACDAGVQKSAYYEWRAMVQGLERADWLAALAPALSPTADGIVSEIAACHPQAWDFLKSDYLRPEKPAFSACYRRMKEACALEGWSPVPSERALRRRLEAQVPRAVVVMTRDGKDKAKQLYPAQRRSRRDLHAMQAVNMDGHKLDLFVRIEGRKQPVRMFLIGIQDLYSGKILAWRIAPAETWDATRLVIGDMVEAYGIPESIDLDNGRAFAGKHISGGAKTRYRNKIDPDDPDGLLVTLGIKPRFVTPASGQSKPVERAWGDFAENISKHPVCSGAFTGKNPMAKPENYMATAIPLDDLKRLTAMQVAEHNARPGRQSENAKGRSFDGVFAESMAAPSTIVRVPTAAQRFLWLLSAEGIKTHKGSGEVHYKGNRYWHIALNQWMGKKVTIRFDPERLQAPIKVYDLQNRLICEAPCIDDAGHHSTQDARTHARLRGDHHKAVKSLAQVEKALKPMELGDILMRGAKALAPPEPVRPRVTRLATSAALDQRADEIGQDEASENFSRALRRMSGGASILEFPGQTIGGGNNAGGFAPEHEPKSKAYGPGQKNGRE